MRYLIIFLLILLPSCSKNSPKLEKSDDYSFSNTMTFDEFKIKLKVYADKSPYPNIDDKDE